MYLIAVALVVCGVSVSVWIGNLYTLSCGLSLLLYATKSTFVLWHSFFFLVNFCNLI